MSAGSDVVPRAMASNVSDVWKVGDFRRSPEPLVSAPSCILGQGNRHTARPPRIDKPEFLDPVRGSSGADQATATQAVPVANRERQKRVDESSKAVTAPALLDSCEGDHRRVGNCRIQLLDGRIVAVPINPGRYCKDLTDAGQELIAVEMQAASQASDIAWLEDDQVSAVMVETQDNTVEISREKLRTFVRQRVPLHPCGRDLRRAVYKLCRPQGNFGPTLTLVPTADALKLVTES